MGFDINEDDFVLVDSSDKRTNYSLQRLRAAKADIEPGRYQLAKERIASHVGMSSKDVEVLVKRLVNETPLEKVHWNMTRLHVQNRLKAELRSDLSDYFEDIDVLFLGSSSWE